MRTPAWMLVAGGGLMALLVLTAILQYRWVGQVSDAERDRLHASATTAADRFANDFDGELTRLFAALQVPQADLDAGGGHALAQGVARWGATASFPRLPGDIYVVRLDRTTALLKLDGATGRLAAAPWPASLAPLQAATAGGAHTLVRALDLQSLVPALVVPVLPSRVVIYGAHESGDVRFDQGAVPALVIVMLNMTVIEHDVLPALARRDVAGEGTFGFDVAVVNARTGALIYSSDPGWTPAAHATADVARDLFELRPNALAFSQPGEPGTRPGVPPPGSVANERFAITVFKRQADAGAGTRELTRLQWGGAGWRLLLRSKAGSLEAVVQQSRRRNLAVSGLLLLLVAASLALLIAAARRAQRLAAQQIEFVAAVSHELRTPLAVIRSAGENLADGVVSDAAQLRRYGETIGHEGRRLSELVDRVLEFAAVASGRATVRHEPVALARVVEQAIEGCEPFVRERGARVETRIEAGLPPTLGDAAALRSVVQNLVLNALKYGGADRWVGVRVARAPGGRPAVEIAVDDHGSGIDAADLPHLFEPFYRGRAAAATSGTGVGLSVVRRIVRAHGGDVSAQSRGGLTSFVVRLPAVKGTARHTVTAGVAE
ncbi:MAG: HAMP domain-containing histidine kinase [Acidobacteriota bacterium]|nr:HAMP domain-containing histidine kinase [Acidobacteriota bacterium]